MTRPRAAARPKTKWRGILTRQLHSWHSISAAISLVSMLLFTVTGLTLNHAGAISAKPVVVERTGELPTSLRPLLGREMAADARLPVQVAVAVREATGIDTAGRAVEWSGDEAYIAMPRPGGDAWVSIDRRSGAIKAETTDRGWISYLNDLHKGRNAGSAWFWFIDLFAVAALVFTLTGLVLLQLHARHRPSSWPLVAAGLVLPAAIALFLIH